MKFIERLFQALNALGLTALANRLQCDWSRPDGFWHTHLSERHSACSFLHIYSDERDEDARFTLCPTTDEEPLLEEIISDVIPVIRQKLGV